MPEIAAPWGALSKELSRWSDLGLSPTFWVRDDDAISMTAALERLAKLAEMFGVQIGLACVPAHLDTSFAKTLQSNELPFHPMCHGWRHANYGTSEQPAEFGTHRSQDLIARDLNTARERFAELTGDASPFFVPPFAQIAGYLVKTLPELGFGGLSNAPRRSVVRLSKFAVRLNLPANSTSLRLPADGLHVHVDPIDWNRGTAKPDESVVRSVLLELVVRRKGFVAPNTPIGILTHHLAHDERIWDVSGRLLETLEPGRKTQFPPLAHLIALYGFAARPVRQRGPQALSTHRHGAPSRMSEAVRLKAD